jgi:hypothetical protein
LSKKAGRYGRCKQAPILCCANFAVKEGLCVIAGTATGDLYVFKEREVTSSVEKAHAGPILCFAEGGPACLFLVSGGKHIA